MNLPSIKSRPSALIAALGACALFTGCSDMNPVEAISADTVQSLQANSQILPFNQLNAAVQNRHPSGQVDHAALDKEGDRYLYQALVTDAYKLQWFVELDAKTGAVVSDKQEAH